VGRFRPPRRRTVWRLGAVAALLLTAAGAVHAGAGSPSDSDRSALATPEPAATDPTPPAGRVPPVGLAPPDVAGVGPTELGRVGRPEAGRVGPPDLGGNRPPERAVPDWPGDGRLPIPAGMVGVPVRLADPAGLALLRPGDRVDLFAVADEGAPVPLAAGVTVLAVDAGAAALLVALAEPEGRAVVAAGTRAGFAITIRG